MTVRCGVSPTPQSAATERSAASAAALILPIGNPGSGLRSDPPLSPARAAKQQPSRRGIDPDGVDGVDRADVIDVNRGDARGLQEMVSEKFAPGRHRRSEADLDVSRQPCPLALTVKRSDKPDRSATAVPAAPRVIRSKWMGR